MSAELIPEVSTDTEARMEVRPKSAELKCGLKCERKRRHSCTDRITPGRGPG
jgi:hypothetical protein